MSKYRNGPNGAVGAVAVFTHSQYVGVYGAMLHIKGGWITKIRGSRTTKCVVSAAKYFV